MKTLGVIGGVGPMATSLFMRRLVEMTDAGCDQEHIHVIADCCPQIPDRTEYLLGNSLNSPVSKMIDIGRRLADHGAEVIAIPCVTASCFYDELKKGISLPIIDIPFCIMRLLKECGIKNVGIMATSGTLYGGVFQKELTKADINFILPTETQQKALMRIIYEGLKGGRPIQITVLEDISNALFESGADVIILGCTELSIIRDLIKPRGKYIDCLDVLAREAVKLCGSLKPKFESLLF